MKKREATTYYSYIVNGRKKFLLAPYSDYEDLIVVSKIKMYFLIISRKVLEIIIISNFHSSKDNNLSHDCCFSVLNY